MKIYYKIFLLLIISNLFSVMEVSAVSPQTLDSIVQINASDSQAILNEQENQFIKNILSPEENLTAIKEEYTDMPERGFAMRGIGLIAVIILANVVGHSIYRKYR